MKEQDAAHSFEDGWKHDYDFLKSIKDRLFNEYSESADLETIDEILHIVELTRLRSELQQKDEIIEVLKRGMQKGSEIYAHLRFDDEPFTPYQLALQEIEKLKSELQRERETISKLAEILVIAYDALKTIHTEPTMSGSVLTGFNKNELIKIRGAFFDFLYSHKNIESLIEKAKLNN